MADVIKMMPSQVGYESPSANIMFILTRLDQSPIVNIFIIDAYLHTVRRFLLSTAPLRKDPRLRARCSPRLSDAIPGSAP